VSLSAASFTFFIEKNIEEFHSLNQTEIWAVYEGKTMEEEGDGEEVHWKVNEGNTCQYRIMDSAFLFTIYS